MPNAAVTDAKDESATVAVKDGAKSATDDADVETLASMFADVVKLAVASANNAQLALVIADALKVDAASQMMDRLALDRPDSSKSATWVADIVPVTAEALVSRANSDVLLATICALPVDSAKTSKAKVPEALMALFPLLCAVISNEVVRLASTLPTSKPPESNALLWKAAIFYAYITALWAM